MQSSFLNTDQRETNQEIKYDLNLNDSQVQMICNSLAIQDALKF